YLSFGKTNIFLQEMEGTIRVYNTFNEGLEKEDSESIAYQSFAFVEKVNSIICKPDFPMYPFVIKFNSALRLKKGAKLKLFLNLPPFCKILTTNQQESKLCEIPDRQMSHTWFGNEQKGELCYWLPSNIAFQEHEVEVGHEILCELDIFIEEIQNSDEVILERVKLETTNIEIYEKDGKLRSSKVLITYSQGVDFKQNYNYSISKPDIQGYSLLTTARSSRGKWDISKLNEFIKVI
ncbi:MAG: hypothetical protein KDK45_21350, partial [Leptospiraceae bacterium]|nr:hypothetical protein [Leptospiraceae bacterium]